MWILLVLSLSHGFAEDDQFLTSEITEIEKNRLYMIHAGQQEGLKKGDAAHIMRDGEKIAELRLSSVLADSAMADVVDLVDPSGIEESDVVIFPTIQAKAGGEDVQMKKEVEDSLKEEPQPEAQPEPGTQQAAQTKVSEEKSALEQKLAQSESALQAKIEAMDEQLRELQQNKEQETAGLQAELAKKEEAMKAIHKEKFKLEFDLKEKDEKLAGLREDLESAKTSAAAAGAPPTQPFEKRIESLNTDITSLKREYQAELSAAKEKSRQELFQEYERWQSKMNDLKEGYEEQLGKQQEVIKEKQSSIVALRNEKFGLAAEMGERDQEITKLKTRVAGLEQELKESEKSLQVFSADEKQAAAELAAIKKQYEEKLKVQKADWEKELIDTKSQLESKIVELEAELSQLQDDKKRTAGRLAEDLKNREALVSSLNEQNAELTINLEESRNEINQLKTEINDLRSSGLKEIGAVKQPLEQQIRELSQEIIALKKDHEEKLKAAEDKRKEFEILSEKSYQKLLTEKKDLEEKSQKREQELQQQVANSNSQLQELRDRKDNEMTTLVAQMDRLHKEFNGVNEDKEKTVAALQLKLKESENTVASLTNEKNKLTSEFNQTQKQLVESQQKGESAAQLLEGKAQQLTAELAAVKKDYAEKLAAVKEESWQALLAEKKQWQMKLEDMEKGEAVHLKAQGDELEQRFNKREKLLEAEIAGLNGQISELKDKKDSKVLMLVADLETKQALINSLTQEKTHLDAQLKQSNQELILLKDSLSKTEQELKSLKATQDENTRLAQQPLEAKIDQLNAQLQVQKQEAAQASLVAQEEWGAKLDALKRDQALTLGQQKKDFENRASEIGMLVTKLKEKELHVQSLTKEKEGVHKELTKNIEQFNKLKEDFSNLEMELDSAKITGEGKIRSVKQPLEREIEELRSELKLQKEDFKNQLNTANATREETIRLAKQPLEAKIDQLNAQLQVQKQEAAQAVLVAQKELFTKVKDKEFQVESLTKEKDGLHKELTKNIEQLNKLKENFSNLEMELDSAKITGEGKIRSVKQPLEIKIEELMSQLKLQKGEFENQLNTANATREETIRLAKQPLEAKIDQLNAQLQVQKQEAAQAVLVAQKELFTKVKDKEFQVESLTKEKDGLHKELTKNIEQFNKLKEDFSNLEMELDSAKITGEGKLRSVKQPLEIKIEELTNQLKLQKEELENKLKYAQESSRQAALAEQRQWQIRLDAVKGDYEAKLKLQRQNLGDQFVRSQAMLQNKIFTLSDAIEQLEMEKDADLFALETGYEDKLSSLKDESRQTIIALHHELSSLQENYKDRLQLLELMRHKPSPLEQNSWGPSSLNAEDYYTRIRETILDNFRKFDFARFKDKESFVKIEFELFADGSLKDKPKFLGTENEDLKNMLYQHFQKALPFPPFPDNIKKKSQRFTIIISFKVDEM